MATRVDAVVGALRSGGCTGTGFGYDSGTRSNLKYNWVQLQSRNHDGGTLGIAAMARGPLCARTTRAETVGSTKAWCQQRPHNPASDRSGGTGSGGICQADIADNQRRLEKTRATCIYVHLHMNDGNWRADKRAHPARALRGWRWHVHA